METLLQGRTLSPRANSFCAIEGILLQAALHCRQRQQPSTSVTQGKSLRTMPAWGPERPRPWQPLRQTRFPDPAFLPPSRPESWPGAGKRPLTFRIVISLLGVVSEKPGIPWCPSSARFAI